MKRALPALLLALGAVACGGTKHGAGVYSETPSQRQARQEAEFAAGEKLGIDGLRHELGALGVGPDEYALVVEPDHQIEVIQLRVGRDRMAKLDRDALASLVLDSNFRLTFADPAAERAVDVTEELFRREMAKEIAVLKRHGDWERVPRLRRGEPLQTLAHRIEDWCGFEPGGALHTVGGRWLEYSHAPVDTAVREPVPGVAAARFDCLRRVVYATQLRRHFIGYRGEPPPPLYPT
ncbi:hypothetical protein GCM10011515_25030 [Tsuneonella deserti]|uniref:Group 4 capsule polysaccharide lipoprotein GfcB/YjbF n=1 Tax=Tsuneonella deserti TaxID=2035528 RepID=A0ABQ1SAK9_9SPHN|nr:hypothetical protein GCM10011515_25030 [Tsuneonella deserti]